VGVDVSLPGATARGVESDNEGGARLAVRHLYELGHRRIATITGLLESSPGSARLRGYRRELQALGLAFRDELVAYGDFYADSGRAGTAQLLALDEPPTAVFAASDMMALGVITAATDAGMSVPRDLAVVGFDDMELAAHVQPPLTTLRQDRAGLGQAAGQALIGLIDGEPGPAPGAQLPVELVTRGSTAPPRAG
jgi:LacI family transcriptional regulator